MKFKPHIEAIHRYLINDVDRSPFLRLDKNEFSFPFPPPILEEIRAAVGDYLLQAYPSTHDTLNHAAILLEHADENQILLTSGSDYALKLCYEALGHPGDRVALPNPTYAMNEVYAQLAEMSIVPLPYGRDLKLAQDHLFASLGQAAMIVLANPNQPTGRRENDQLIRELLDKTSARQQWLIIDEAYHAFSGYTAAHYVDDFDNLIVIRSFSKSYGIAGLRVGAIISQKKNIDYFAKVLPVYPVNALALEVLRILSQHKPYFAALHQELRCGRDLIIAFYNSLKCHAFPSDANFVMVETHGVFDLPSYLDHLKRQRILVRGPWTTPPFTQAFRVTTTTSPQVECLKQATLSYLDNRQPKGNQP